VAHLVYISIVGIDRVPMSYYRVKLEEERLVESSGLAWTILRATRSTIWSASLRRRWPGCR
jgi:uncharacterized protein YbjT (DUF2867 family)